MLVFLPHFIGLSILLSWWIFFAYQKFLLVFLLVPWVMALYYFWRLAKRDFFRHLLWWINLTIAYAGQWLFLLLTPSKSWRQVLAFLLAGFWLFILLVMKRYWQKQKQIFNLDYLAWQRFWFYLAYFFVLSGLFSLAVYIQLPFYYVLAVILLISFLFAWQLLLGERKWSSLLLLVWLIICLSGAVYLLPISYYAAALLVAILFFAWIDYQDKLSYGKWGSLIGIAVSLMIIFSALLLVF